MWQSLMKLKSTSEVCLGPSIKGVPCNKVVLLKVVAEQSFTLLHMYLGLISISSL